MEKPMIKSDRFKKKNKRATGNTVFCYWKDIKSCWHKTYNILIYWSLIHILCVWVAPSFLLKLLKCSWPWSLFEKARLDRFLPWRFVSQHPTVPPISVSKRELQHKHQVPYNPKVTSFLRKSQKSWHGHFQMQPVSLRTSPNSVGHTGCLDTFGFGQAPAPAEEV